MTMALQVGSPAIDRIPKDYTVPNGNTRLCPATDQRSVTRPQGTACDIGRYELVDHLQIVVGVSAGYYKVHLSGAALEVGSTVNWRVQTAGTDNRGNFVVTSSQIDRYLFTSTCPSGHVIADASGREVRSGAAHDSTAHYEGDPC